MSLFIIAVDRAFIYIFIGNINHSPLPEYAVCDYVSITALSAMHSSWKDLLTSPSSIILDSIFTMPAGLKSAYHSQRRVGWWRLNVCPAVILLSFVLAVGFLLIILSCALWANWLPLLVGAYYFIPQVVFASSYSTLSIDIRACSPTKCPVRPLRRRRLFFA